MTWSGYRRHRAIRPLGAIKSAVGRGQVPQERVLNGSSLQVLLQSGVLSVDAVSSRFQNRHLVFQILEVLFLAPSKRALATGRDFGLVIASNTNC